MARSKEEKAEYSRGYNAGRRTAAKRDRAAERYASNYNRAFIAALPSALNGRWEDGAGKAINTVDDRVALAHRMAAAAVERMK